MNLSDRELTMLKSFLSLRIHRLDEVRDLETFRSLQRRGLVFTKDGRPEVPRSSDDMARAVKQNVAMIQHEEIYVSALGMRVYGEHLDNQKEQTT